LRRILARRLGMSYYVLCQFTCMEVPRMRRLNMLIDTGSTTTTVYAERVGISNDLYRSLEPGEPHDVIGGTIIPRKLHDVYLIFETVEGLPLTIWLRECNTLFIRAPTLEDGLLGMDVLDHFRRWGAEREDEKLGYDA